MRRLAALALLIAGCSTDPTNDRLQPGQLVLVTTKLKDEWVTVGAPGGGTFAKSDPGSAAGYLGAGDTAQVITDENPNSESRPVTVKVLTAKYSDGIYGIPKLAGTVCTVPRKALRAMKRE